MDDIFKLGALNHVGIAVPDLDTAMTFYRDILGVTDMTAPKVLPEHGVRFAFVNLPAGQVELIEPYGENSPIDRFLKRHGKGGQHHICFEVGDIAQASSVLQDRGMRVLGQPRIGAHGTLVVFLHPADAGGVLIELMQSPDTAVGVH